MWFVEFLLIFCFVFSAALSVPIYIDAIKFVCDECCDCRRNRRRLGELRWDIADERWRTMRLTNKRPPPAPRDDDDEWYDESRVPC